MFKWMSTLYVLHTFINMDILKFDDCQIEKQKISYNMQMIDH